MPKRTTSNPAEPVLLAGGNPQIPMGYGDAPVRAYIAAMPGWKREAGSRLDALVVEAVPGVRKAVKYNSPLYGAPHADPEHPEWFMSLHCFAKYIKVAFFNGGQLQPIPPVASKQPAVRYFHLHEGASLDEHQFSDWARQASRLPGEKL